MNTTDNSLLFESNRFLKPDNQFWTLQIGGWIGYFIIVFLAIIRPQFDDPNFYFAGQMLNLGVESLSGFVLSCLQWFLIRRIVHRSLRITLLASFVSAAILGCVFNIIKLASYKTIIYNQVWYHNLNMLEFGGWLLFSVTTMFAFTAIFFIMLYNNRLQSEHEMLLRAQNSAKEAQLQMLRYQLNPHFMFNTLNAISTLILKNENDKANEMLDKLCAFFRYSLDQTGNNTSTLSEDVDLVELYLSIEKVRFGDRLQVKIDMDDACKQALVPNMLLQPVVENAIKYGIESKKSEGLISITARHVGDSLHISVQDNGDGSSKQTEKGFGIGLNNTQERLNTFFNNTCTVLLSENDDANTVVTLTMPFTPKVAHA